MSKTPVPEKQVEQGGMPEFAALMRAYKKVNDHIEELKDEKKDQEEQLAYLKKLIQTEVKNMDLGPKSVLRIEGVGSFNFTSQRYYKVPSGDARERLMRKLLEEKDGVALLTIGKKDLNEWCKDREDQELEIPAYLEYFEQKDVPVISLKKAHKAKGNETNE